MEFLNVSKRLLRRISDNLGKMNVGNSLDSGAIDFDKQWLDEMKKAYEVLYDKIEPCITDVYVKGVLQRTATVSTTNG